jgi:hypothetical protein
MRMSLAVTLALLTGCGGGPEDPVGTEPARYAKSAQALCVPISSSLAFDAAGQRTAFRDTMVDRLQSSSHRGVNVTDEFDWMGDVTEHAFDEPGTLGDYTVQVSWQFFPSVNKKLPLTMKSTHPAQPQLDTVDRFFHDQNARIYRFEHNYAQGDPDDRIETFTHDADGYLIGIDIERKDKLLSRSYAVSYDQRGRIIRWDEVFTDVYEEFTYDDYGFLRDWKRRVPGEIQEHVVVAWTTDNQPMLVESHGTFRKPQIGYCP